MRHRGDAYGRSREQDRRGSGRACATRPAGASLLRDRRGASLVEYMVLVGFIAVVVIGGFRAFGTSVHGKVEAQAACVTSMSCGTGQGDYALTSPDVTMSLSAPTAETSLPLAEVAPEPEPAPTPPVETTPSIADKAWYEYIWNGLAGFFGDGLWGDVYGLYELVTDIPGTVVSLWDLGRMLVQGQLFINGQPNPLYDYEQAQKLGTLIEVVGESIEDYYVNQTDRAVGRTIYEVITLVVAPAKLLKIAKAKWLARASKVTKLEKTAEILTDAEKIAKQTKKAEELAEGAKDAEKIANAAEDLSEVAKAWKATKLDIDPVTMAQLEKYGLKPDSVVYRVMEEKYLDADNLRVSGNPKSMAQVRDPYDLVDNQLVKVFEDAGETLPPQVPRKVPSIKNASTLDRPGLNVAVKDPSAYAGKDSVKVAIKVEDVIRNGGKVYPDHGAAVQGIDPIYITFDGSVPYTRVP
ncbi:MAG: Flp family type IVb pilin [Polyangiaceae bacterium]